MEEGRKELFSNTKDQHSFKNMVRAKAVELGFDNSGFSAVDFLPEEAKYLRQWLDRGAHAGMTYMENHFEKRTDPALLFENAKSVISLTFNYFPKNILPTENNYKISKYAYGKDYHFVLKEKLWTLIRYMQSIEPGLSARPFVDSAPVLDKAWAQKSGLGWIGKNTLLIQQRKGSFFFIGEIITDYAFPPDEALTANYCGKCTRCIEACPTQALRPYSVDANRCISYLTIEHKGEIPETFAGGFQNWIFGCDICQDVCPYNIRFAVPTQEEAFSPPAELMEMNKEKWENLSREDFRKWFKKSPLKRSKYEGLQRNIRFAKEIKKQPVEEPPPGTKRD